MALSSKPSNSGALPRARKVRDHHARRQFSRSLSVFIAILLLLFGAVESAWAKRGAAAAKPAPAESSSATSATAGPLPLKIAYLAQQRNEAISLNFDPLPNDLGLRGARLAIEDNNTTGQFTRQSYELSEVLIEAGGTVLPAFDRLVAEGFRYILVDLPTVGLLQVGASPRADTVLVFDVANRDDRLRGADCAAHVLHTLPSRAMLADALAQYLLKKRWTKWFLVVGPQAADQLFAEAVERAAKRFGGKLVARKAWEHAFDDRRTPESEVPVFTQGVDYEVLVVADEEGAFGDYFSYRTWLPRPVVGTQGLIPTAWHPTHEAWGALQLQNRFRERTGRWMHAVDYAAWLAVRAIGEAATRTGSTEFKAIRSYLLSERFTLAGFKGVPLSFRPWDRQLRQPVLLAQPRSLVAVAPIEGFIHPQNELDTLGYDESESACQLGR